MDDDVDPVFCDQRRYLRPVPAVTDDERPPLPPRRHRRAHEPCGCRYSRRRR